MCRLYAQVSAKPRTAADFLADSDRSLLAQADHRRVDYQKDGWGIGWFAGGKANLVKSPKAAFDEARRFKTTAAKAKSGVVIGHLRAASNPMRLPLSRLMRAENAQPFTDGRFIFAHNGTVNIPLEAKKFLGPYASRIQGENDSEIYFWMFRKHYDLYGSVPEALKACVRELWTLWDYCEKRYKSKKEPYRGLNALVSDGSALHAMCVYPVESPKRSLFDPSQPWARMTWARREGRVIVASEKLDGGEWNDFSNCEIVSARYSPSGALTVSTQAFDARP